MAREGQGYPCCQHDMMMMMIRELPITLAYIKMEALKDDFIHTTKNKIYNKEPNVLEVFSL